MVIEKNQFFVREGPVEDPEAAGERAAENPSEGMNDQLNELNEAIKKQEEASSEEEKKSAAEEAQAAASKYLDAFGERAGLSDAKIKEMKKQVGKIENFKELSDAIAGAAETDVGASDTVKGATGALRGAIKGAVDQLDKAASNLIDSKAAEEKFNEASKKFKEASNAHAQKIKDLYDANIAVEGAKTGDAVAKAKAAQALSDAKKAFETSQEAYEKARKEHGEAFDEAFPEGSDAKKKVEAQGGGKWRSFKELMKNRYLIAALVSLAGSLGIYFGLKALADAMTGCYLYIGTESSQLASCHGLEDEGLEAACVCGTLSDAKTGGATGSGTCCDGGGSSADCGGQVYCAQATCKRCSSTDCANPEDPPGKACGCAPGPPCNRADMQHAIQYRYTKYTAWDALAGIFNQAANDWDHGLDSWIGVVKKILIIVAILAGIALLIWVVAKVVNHIRHKKGGDEGGKAHDNVVVVQEPAARRSRSRRKN